MIWIAEKDKLKQVIEDVKEIGQKALGLCRMPDMWTLPFFVVSRSFCLEVGRKEDAKEKYAIAEGYTKTIKEAILKLGLGKDLIVRSSGQEEGMNERGKYESIIVRREEDLAQKLILLVENLSGFLEVQEMGMPLIVQTYVDGELNGHISNERRCAKDSRDFVYEYQENIKKIYGTDQKSVRAETGRVALRKSREEIEVGKYVRETLTMQNDWDKNILKVVCTYFQSKEKRIHLEFVCCKHVLYLVQCDVEREPEGAVNPEEYDVNMNRQGGKFAPKVLRTIQESDRGKYKKIENVLIYKETGEEIPPFYLLDDEEILKKLQAGIFPDGLKKDIEVMTKNSLVIRTDLPEGSLEEKQLLGRSNELRCLEDAQKFLLKTSEKLKEKGIEKYAFLLHNFIPAQIAAFVYVKPLDEVVEIQTLWGLPEGLYYNAHDRIIVHTKTIDAEKMDKEKFEIKEITSYKEKFISPNANGEWVVKRLKPPYDWRCTIKNPETVKDIAYRARKIAEQENKELSIMWFVGIDEKYYHTDNMPWYHEVYDRKRYYYAAKEACYKKKYFYEEEIVVETRKDVEWLKTMNPWGVGVVKIQPKNDQLLRDKIFLKEVGGICKDKNVPVFLEGAVLAHPFYQLKKMGVTVLTTHFDKSYEEEIEYNKLVRDKVPEVIEENGELVSCGVIEGVPLLKEIKDKLLEEAYEIVEAKRKEEVLEEMADLREVCIALEKQISYISKDKKAMAFAEPIKIEENVAEFEGAVLEKSKEQQWIRVHGQKVQVTLEKEKGNEIRVDFLFGANETETEMEDIPECVGETKKNLLKTVLKIYLESEEKECMKQLEEADKLMETLCEEHESDAEELEEVRVRKKRKRGAFEKGYVLLKTQIKVSEEPPLALTGGMVKNRLYENLKEQGRMDVDTVRGNCLLIRLKIPVCGEVCEWVKSTEKINRYFGEQVSIKIKQRVEGTRLQFALETVPREYEQLRLEWYK